MIPRNHSLHVNPVLLFLSLAMAYVFSALSVGAEPDADKEWTINLQLKEKRNFIPTAKVDRLLECVVDATTEDGNTVYEKLWYHEGKALALERKRPAEKFIANNRGENIVLSVKLPANDSDEATLRAAADAIIRVFLDLASRQQTVQVVELNSAHSVQSIAKYLVDYGLERKPAGKTDGRKLFTLSATEGSLDVDLQLQRNMR